jgi:hypothetical protein
MALLSVKVAGRLMKSPVFIILIIFWIIIALSLASVSQPASFYASLISDSGNVPQYQTTTITELNGTNATVYSQTFNEYGVAEQGWNVTYAISVFNGQKDTIVNSHYAGITDITGLVVYNITGLQKDQVYTVSETVGYRGYEWANHTASILTFATEGTPSSGVVSGQLSITPVLSDASPSHFSLHIWKIPQNGKANYTVLYGVYSGNSFGQAINLMVDGNFPNHLVNFTMMNQANIQTNLNYTGEPYYYTIGVRSENGSIAGTAMFGSRVSSQAKMEDSVFLMFAGLSIFLILIFLYVTIYQSNAFGKVIKSGRIRNFLLGKEDLHYPEEISGRYGEILLTSVLLSTPFILISALVAYLFSIRIYGISPGAGVLLSYTAASFITVLFATSLTVIVLRSRFGEFIVHNYAKKTMLSRLVTFVPGYLVTFFYLSLLTNYGMLSFLSSSQQIIQKVTLILYSVNPMTYLWLLGSYFSKDIAATGTSTFIPSALGLSPLTLLLIGLAWIIAILVIPWVIFSKREKAVIGAAHD